MFQRMKFGSTPALSFDRDVYKLRLKFATGSVGGFLVGVNTYKKPTNNKVHNYGGDIDATD